VASPRPGRFTPGKGVSHIKGKIYTQVFGNRVPRKIYGPEREETTGDWRRLHNKELHDLYYSPNIITLMEIDRTCCK
jgi:hypothetical protein